MHSCIKDLQIHPLPVSDLQSALVVRAEGWGQRVPKRFTALFISFKKSTVNRSAYIPQFVNGQIHRGLGAQWRC